MNKGRLLVISGPSGTGKGTICKECLERNETLIYSVSLTTRSPREGEVHGREYFFVSREEFEDRINNEQMLEYAHVYGQYYGTPKAEVFQLLEEGKDVVLELDIQGAMQIKKMYSEAIFIFILPPSMQELRKRITGRGTETEKLINMRLSEAINEISYIEKYDYCIVNENVGEAVRKVEAIIIAEHSRVTEDVVKLIEKYKEEV